MKYILSFFCLFLITGCFDNAIPKHVITSEGVKNPDRKWVQKEFVLSTFRAVPSSFPPNYSFDPSTVQYYAKAISTLKEANFNYIETAWNVSQSTLAILEECDRQGGISVMAQDMSILGGMTNKLHIPFSPDSVEKYLQLYGSFKSLKSAYVYDEPFVEHNQCVRDNINEFEKLRPDLLGFSVLNPSYCGLYAWTNYREMRYDEHVDKYLETVNPAIIATDYYAFYNDPTVEEFYQSLFWKDMGLYRDRALKHNMPHWFYYQGAIHGKFEERLIRPEHILVQVWSAVMYGVKGLSSYTALYSVVDTKGEKDYLFETTRMVNSQIKALGNTLLNLKSTGVYHAESIIPDEYASDISESDYIATLPKHISVGEFQDTENNVYLLIVNKDFNSGHDCIIPLKDTFRIYACDKNNNGEQSILYNSTDNLPAQLEAGEGVLIRIEKTSVKPKIIEYNII